VRILLVSVNRVKVPYPVYPLGLDYVAAGLDEAHQVELLDLIDSPDEAPLVEAIEAFAPELVGISLRNIDNTDSADSRGYIDELCRAVAAVRSASRAKVVLGGAGFTLFPAALLARAGADYGVVGEGERFAALVDAVDKGLATAGLEGVIEAGRPGTPAPPPFGGRLGRLLPAAGGRPVPYLARGGMLNLQTKRGCPFSCFYCTYPLIEGRRLRRIEPGQVGAEARALEAAGARYLFMADSVFNSDHAHAAAVAEAMRAAGVTVPWGAFFAPLAAPDGFYQSLAECGCTHVEFGTDTLSAAMLRTYRKAFTAADVLATHRAAVSAGLHVAHYFMLGGPGEGEGTLDETLTAAEQLSKSVCFFFCGIRIYPGTELHRIALEQGQLRAGDDLLEPVFYRPERIDPAEVIARVRQRGGGRLDWVIGAGGQQTERILERMYARGRTGPLWELLIR